MESGWEFEYDDYFVSFKNLHNVCKILKYQDFQYRLTLGKLIFNQDLFAWGYRTNDQCTFCNNSTETSVHVLYECEKVQSLIIKLYDYCDNCGIEYSRDKFKYLLNTFLGKRSHVIAFVSVFLKQYLYKCHYAGKCPNMYNFLMELELHHRVEFSIELNEHKLSKHINRWSPIFEFESENHQ